MSKDYPLSTGVTENGIRIIVNPDPWVPAVSLNLWYGVGSVHETRHRTGLAHLFEHLMFLGSANAAQGEHLRLLQAAGGDANATTSFDRTDYYDTIPSGALDLALWLEADRLATLVDCLNEDNLSTEREVVKEEKRMRYDNIPYGNAFRQLMELCFPPDHPYAHTPIGSMEDLEAATLDDVKQFFTAHYCPSNLIMTISGDVQSEKVFDRVNTYFSAIDTHSVPDFAIPTLPHLDQIPRRCVTADVPQDAVYCAWRIPPVTDPTDDATSLGLSILSEGLTARLYRRLVMAGIADSVDAFDLGLSHGNSLVGLIATCDEDTSAERVEEEMMAVVDEFCRVGPTQEELNRAKICDEREWLSDLASIETRAETLCESLAVWNDPDVINTRLDRIKAQTSQAVWETCATLLDPSHRAVLTYRSAQ